jgi:hypothetical protein
MFFCPFPFDHGVVCMSVFLYVHPVLPALLTFLRARVNLNVCIVVESYL